jgi:hypothetical protein
MAQAKLHPTAQLLVEGNDDLHVMYSLLQKFNVPNNFSIKDCQGVEKLLEQIPVQLKVLQKIGLVLDADTNIANRWQSLKVIFEKSGFLLPEQIDTNGLIIEQNDKTIGIWLMPNNNQNGMLEDFIRFLIPNDDKLLSKAIKVLEEIETEGLNHYAKVHKSKAVIHTWLAWQEKPGTPLGQAITARYLTTDNEVVCNSFIKWIKKVFED